MLFNEMLIDEWEQDLTQFSDVVYNFKKRIIKYKT